MWIDSKSILRVAIAGLLCLAPMGMRADEKAPQCKDDAECALYNSILQDTNPKTKLEKLQQWEQKYPVTDFAKVRATLMLTTYVAAGQLKDALAVAKKTLASDPKDFNALYYTMLLTQQVYAVGDNALLDDGEKASKALLATIDKAPEGVTPEKWAELRPPIEKLANTTTVFVDMQRKNWDAAEGDLKKSFQLDPNNSSLTYWMAITQANKKNNSAALYYYARAAAYDGAGALAPAGRQSVLAEVTKMYNGYHGTSEGLNELLASAKTTPDPPSGFHIKSKSEIAKEKFEKESGDAEKFAKEHPEWALWKNLKETLAGPTGAEYFASAKDSKFPALKAKVVKLEPAVKPKTIQVAVEDGTSDGTVADATLKFETALPGKVEPGTELTFKGAPESYTASPLMVVFNIVEKDDLQGWTGKNAAAAPAHRPVSKKPAPKK